MDLYLMRHGIAVEAGTAYYPHDDRPLTEEGRSQLRAIGKGLAKLEVSFTSILSSSLSRALETAQIIGEKVRFPGTISVTRALLPHANPTDILTELSAEERSGTILLVSHQPLVATLVEHLTGLPAAHLEVKKAALFRFKLEAPRPHGAVLKWAISPKILKSLGAA